MVPDAAQRERGIGVELAQDAPSSFVASGVLLRLDSSELQPSRPLGNVARHSLALEIVRAMRDMTVEFGVHLTFHGCPPERASE
jgi:hypothetical protein